MEQDTLKYGIIPIIPALKLVTLLWMQFARQHSSGKPLTFDFLCRALDWPCEEPKTVDDLLHLETVYEMTDLYMWLR